MPAVAKRYVILPPAPDVLPMLDYPTYKWICTACGTSHLNREIPKICPNPDCNPLVRGYDMVKPTKEELKHANVQY